MAADKIERKTKNEERKGKGIWFFAFGFLLPAKFSAHRSIRLPISAKSVTDT
jgi:hypothetical protein